MKKNFLFLTAVAIMSAMSIASCSWDEEMFDTEDIPATYYVRTVNDSLSPNNPSNDTDSSTVIMKANIKRTEADSCHCYLDIAVRALVNGGTGVDLSDTRINVSNVTIKLKVDDSDSLEVFEAVVNSEIMELHDCYQWDELPLGITYERKYLFMKPLCISYTRCFDAEIVINYVTRTKDSALISHCGTIKGSGTVSYSSDKHFDRNVYLNFTVNLATIQFDATVNQYQTEGEQ